MTILSVDRQFVICYIVQLLYTRNAVFTRREIVENLGITDGGRLSRNPKKKMILMEHK